MDDDYEAGPVKITGGKGCLPGEILRKGYTATRKKKGLVNKFLKRGTKYTVRATCIKDVGAKGKGAELIGPLKEGPLSSLGYSHTKPATVRHSILDQAVAKQGRNTVIRRLNAIATYSKVTGPSRSKTYRTDMHYVQKKFV